MSGDSSDRLDISASKKLDAQKVTPISELRPTNVAVIREVYDGENAHETFEIELERALEVGCCVIVIEPSRLGDETGRWISVGNCLHKTAVLSGLSAIAVGLIWRRPLFSTPLAAISWFCTGLYTVSWQFDPCCQYQIETDPKKLTMLPILHQLTSSSPVVLVKKDIKRRVILHSTITTIAAAFCAWKLYNSFK